jgi:hypothetical protein
LWWTSTLPLFLVLFLFEPYCCGLFRDAFQKTPHLLFLIVFFCSNIVIIVFFSYEPIFELFVIYFFGSNLDDGLFLWWDLDLPSLPLPCPWSFIFWIQTLLFMVQSLLITLPSFLFLLVNP